MIYELESLGTDSASGWPATVFQREERLTRHHPPAQAPMHWALEEEGTGTEHKRSSVVIATFQWLESVYSLVVDTDFDRAIDVVFENVELLTDNQCDLMLRSVDLARLEANLLVGLLSITLERRERLPYRDQFVRGVEARLRVLAPERLAGLMVGLR